MRFAVESVTDAVYWLDEPGNILYANNAACTMTGYTLSELHALRMYEINVDLDVANWPAIWGLLKATGSRTFEARHQHKDGSMVDVAVSAHFLCIDDAEFSCAIVRDISGHKVMDQRLRHAEKMEAVGRLAGGVAHDFNNQLAAILGYTEVLRRRARAIPEVLELLDPMRDVVQVAADLTSRLLAFSRPGEPDLRPVDLHEELRSVLAILSRSIDKQIRVEANLAAEHHWSLGDASQLQSAFLNLLLNARDAIVDCGTIRICTTNVVRGAQAADTINDPLAALTPGDYVLIEIQDTGVGIRPENLQRVFEPFYTTKEVGAGGGLGLAVVYGTLRRHHGLVTVESSVGKGSVFALYLPVARPPRVLRANRPEPLSLRLHGHVLLVDDEPSVRDAAGRMVESLGCSVTAVAEREEAVTYFQTEHATVDLILLDVMMPGRSARDTLAEILKIDSRVPVLLVSGYSDDGEAEALLAMGAKALIRKPFSMATLAKHFSELLPPRPGP